MGIEVESHPKRDKGGKNDGILPRGHSFMVAGFRIDYLIYLWIMEKILESTGLERSRFACPDAVHFPRWTRDLVPFMYRTANRNFGCSLLHEAKDDATSMKMDRETLGPSFFGK